MANINKPTEQELTSMASKLTKAWQIFWIAISIILMAVAMFSRNIMVWPIAAICWGLSEGEVITKKQANNEK